MTQRLEGWRNLGGDATTWHLLFMSDQILPTTLSTQPCPGSPPQSTRSPGPSPSAPTHTTPTPAPTPPSPRKAPRAQPGPACAMPPAHRSPRDRPKSPPSHSPPMYSLQTAHSACRCAPRCPPPRSSRHRSPSSCPARQTQRPCATSSARS